MGLQKSWNSQSSCCEQRKEPMLGSCGRGGAGCAASAWHGGHRAGLAMGSALYHAYIGRAAPRQYLLRDRMFELWVQCETCAECSRFWSQGNLWQWFLFAGWQHGVWQRWAEECSYELRAGWLVLVLWVFSEGLHSQKRWYFAWPKWNLGWAVLQESRML